MYIYVCLYIYMYMYGSRHYIKITHTDTSCHADDSSHAASAAIAMRCRWTSSPLETSRASKFGRSGRSFCSKSFHGTFEKYRGISMQNKTCRGFNFIS